MKKLFLLLLLVCSTAFSQNIVGSYEFQYRENRTPTGWSKVDVKGEVVFYEDKKTRTVTIITPKRVELLYVKSRQLFIRQDTFIYTLVDEDYKECSFRIVVNDTLDTIDLYYYSDRVEEKYYKLKLQKCE
jgi:hypothetical protein